MWKLMDNRLNKLLGLYIPLLFIIVMIVSQDTRMGIVGAISILLVIAWGDKNPSIIVPTEKQFKEASKNISESLFAQMGIDIGIDTEEVTPDSMLKEAEVEIDRKRMIV